MVIFSGVGTILCIYIVEDVVCFHGLFLLLAIKLAEKCDDILTQSVQFAKRFSELIERGRCSVSVCFEPLWNTSLLYTHDVCCCGVLACRLGVCSTVCPSKLARSIAA